MMPRVVSFVRGLSETSGLIRTKGCVLNTGRRDATAEARITDARNRLLARATTTCLVLESPRRSAKG
jgi:acyl-coenzyme A thioesterase PaaI-like protein